MSGCAGSTGYRAHQRRLAPPSLPLRQSWAPNAVPCQAAPGTAKCLSDLARNFSEAPARKPRVLLALLAVFAALTFAAQRPQRQFAAPAARQPFAMLPVRVA